jgi:chemotaxis protein CheX
MSTEPVTLTLPAILDLKAARPLADQFLALRGGAVRVDASKVERLGALCLQVLLSAQITWAGDRQALTLKDPSPALEDQARCLGARGGAFRKGASS